MQDYISNWRHKHSTVAIKATFIPNTKALKNPSQQSDFSNMRSSMNVTTPPPYETHVLKTRIHRLYWGIDAFVLLVTTILYRILSWDCLDKLYKIRFVKDFCVRWKGVVFGAGNPHIQRKVLLHVRTIRVTNDTKFKNTWCIVDFGIICNMYRCKNYPTHWLA